MQIYFGKPDPFAKEAIDEYNKFFRQPMKMLAFAGILKNNGGTNNRIDFSVQNRDLLAFVASNDFTELRNPIDAKCG